ncbi:hypothetical protein F5148DRAFT_549425 [Russula earlei]|uniref:Uncharacterized protein n=1 Tax=Russula earlei TaxID=71964 RepID=A0ACC0UFW4_9AGAM|nr:hypothetical protein F5148DRAFT_549425 [Russula earlei]
MDRTVQWDNNLITTKDQHAGRSIRSPLYDADPNSRSLMSPRRRQPSQNSIRGPARESSELSDPFNTSGSGPADEEADLQLATLEAGPDDLDDPWLYTFRPGDTVWIRTEGGNWYLGKVSSNSVKRGQTRQKEGLFYPVIFCIGIGPRIRKHFAPLNGEIKPDTSRTRTLLRRAGWL